MSIKKSHQTKTLTISLPSILYKGLELKAKKTDRSKNYLVRKALESFLDGIAQAENSTRKNKKSSEE